MRAPPASSSRSVESRRTSVDLPEPFWPRMATHSPRSIEKEIGPSAVVRRRRKPSRRRKSLRRPRISTAGRARSEMGCEKAKADDIATPYCDGSEEPGRATRCRGSRARRRAASSMNGAEEHRSLTVAVTRDHGQCTREPAQTGEKTVWRKARTISPSAADRLLASSLDEHGRATYRAELRRRA